MKRSGRHGKRRLKIAPCILSALALLAVGVFFYGRAAAPAEAVAVECFAGASVADGYAAFGGENAKVGLIFYPGGKVDYKAYAPLMSALADADLRCVLIQMPVNLAVLDSGAALRVIKDHPQIHRWYLAGHSLGGAMAALCAASNPNHFSGLILLAAYATERVDLPVLSIYGDADYVLNRDSYEKNRTHLPETAVELVIPGGNHASFGCYGMQKGDGIATISEKEQQSITAEAILGFIASVEKEGE